MHNYFLHLKVRVQNRKTRLYNKYNGGSDGCGFDDNGDDNDDDDECGDDGFTGGDVSEEALVMVVLLMMMTLKATLLMIRW